MTVAVPHADADESWRLVDAAREAGLSAELLAYTQGHMRAGVLTDAGPVWIDHADDIAWLLVDLTTGPTNPEWRHEKRNYSGR
jgi:hypothetical protein